MFFLLVLPFSSQKSAQLLVSVCWVVKARKEQGQEGNKGVTACRSDKNPKDAGCLQEGTGAGTGGQKVLAACRRDKNPRKAGCKGVKGSCLQDVQEDRWRWLCEGGHRGRDRKTLDISRLHGATEAGAMDYKKE